jgi:predicted enzyme related to lactoylglutathione lyase
VGKPAWLPYILVADVPATLERVRQAKGKVVMEPRATLLEGNLAVIADREGGVIGIVSWIAPGATR